MRVNIQASWDALRHEFKPMLSLAGPVVVAELGWMAMGLVDTVMVGRLGPEAIGATGIGSNLFLAFAVFGMGLLLGLDTLVSHAYGAGRIADCHRWLVQGIYLSLMLTVPLTLLALMTIRSMDAWGLHPDVLRLAVPYLWVVTGGILPLLLYACFRRYLQAMGIVRPIMFALVSANVVHILVNWILIFGYFGAPALGVTGAAWATFGSRVMMALVLFIAIIRHDRTLAVRLSSVPLALSVAMIRRLVRLGTPAGTQVLLEFGVFVAATILAGTLAPSALAAHQIALNLASVTFMVPLGVSAAGAVRVGQALGRQDPRGAVHAGWTALAIGFLFMTGAALMFIAVPGPLIRLFSSDTGVIRIGVSLLAVAAVFQLFDGVQGVATGILRGLGDTRTPMVWNLAGHWFVGLPVAYLLCFRVGWGVIGLWWGLSSGLIIVGIVLVRTWAMRAKALS